MFEDRRQSGDYLFRIGENESATWIVLESRNKQPPHLEGWHLTFNLAGGLTIEESEEIAQYLNDNLGDLIIYPPEVPIHKGSDARH